MEQRIRIHSYYPKEKLTWHHVRSCGSVGKKNNQSATGDENQWPTTEVTNGKILASHSCQWSPWHPVGQTSHHIGWKQADNILQLACWYACGYAHPPSYLKPQECDMIWNTGRKHRCWASTKVTSIFCWNAHGVYLKTVWLDYLYLIVITRGKMK